MPVFNGTATLSKGTIRVIVCLIICIALAITCFIVANNGQKFMINSANSGIQAATGVNPSVHGDNGKLNSSGNNEYTSQWDKIGDISQDNGLPGVLQGNTFGDWD